MVQKSDQNWQWKEKRNRKFALPNIGIGFDCFFSVATKKSLRKYFHRCDAMSDFITLYGKFDRPIVDLMKAKKSFINTK